MCRNISECLTLSSSRLRPLSSVCPDGVLHHKFVISHLSLTSLQRTTLFVLDTGTPGTSREDTVKTLMAILELATPRLEIESSLLVTGIPMSSRNNVLLGQ